MSVKHHTTQHNQVKNNQDMLLIPLSHLELYWAVLRGGMFPRLRYMTGSRPEKSMTVAAYSSPVSVTTAVELWRGS